MLYYILLTPTHTMNRILLILASVTCSTILLTSCASSPQVRWSQVEVGMTKQQVVALLGQPKTTTSNGAFVTMEYDFSQQQPAVVHPNQPGHSTYYVMIGRDDRVRSFGAN